MSGTGIRIDALDVEISPSMSHVVPAMKDNKTVRFSIQQIADLVLAAIRNGAPASLDTLNEIAAAIGNDASFSTTVSTALSGKLASSVLDTDNTLAANSDAKVATQKATKGYVDGIKRNANVVINGAFQVNQRVYVSGAATTVGQYTLDRWKVTGTGGITFATAANKTTVTIPSGQTIQQIVEGLNLDTGTYVLSWEGTAQGRINGGSYGATGAVTASLTGGTNATIEFNNGTVANVKLEKGSIATPFERQQISEVIQQCQRYYEKSYNLEVAPGANTLNGMVQNYNASGAVNTVSLLAAFKQQKRVAPAVVAYTPVGAAGFIRDGSGSDRAATTAAVGQSCAVITNSVAGNIANYSCHWTADAEL